MSRALLIRRRAGVRRLCRRTCRAPRRPRRRRLPQGPLASRRPARTVLLLAQRARPARRRAAAEKGARGGGARGGGSASGPQVVTYGGLVRRSDGRQMMWLNNRLVDEREALAGLEPQGQGQARRRSHAAGRIRRDRRRESRPVGRALHGQGRGSTQGAARAAETGPGPKSAADRRQGPRAAAEPKPPATEAKPPAAVAKPAAPEGSERKPPPGGGGSRWISAAARSPAKRPRRFPAPSKPV